MAQYPHMIAHTILHTGPTCACNDDSQPPLGGGTSVLHHALRGAVRRDHRQLQGYSKLFKHLKGVGDRREWWDLSRMGASAGGVVHVDPPTPSVHYVMHIHFRPASSCTQLRYATASPFPAHNTLVPTPVQPPARLRTPHLRRRFHGCKVRVRPHDDADLGPAVPAAAAQARCRRRRRGFAQGGQARGVELAQFGAGLLSAAGQQIDVADLYDGEGKEGGLRLLALKLWAVTRHVLVWQCLSRPFSPHCLNQPLPSRPLSPCAPSSCRPPCRTSAPWRPAGGTLWP